MRTDLLTNREWHVTGNWYAPLAHLVTYKSVLFAEHLHMDSSAGDWDGFLIQRIGGWNHVIRFYQENSGDGFNVSTGEVEFSFSGDVDRDRVIEIINQLETEE